MSAAEKKDQKAAEPAAQAPGMLHEADIGSGEKTPGEKETEEIVKSVPASPKDQAPKDGKQ